MKNISLLTFVFASLAIGLISLSSCENKQVTLTTETFKSFWETLSEEEKKRLLDSVVMADAYKEREAMINMLQGHYVPAQRAEAYTEYYYRTESSSQESRDSLVKSVYFPIEALEGYIEIIKDLCAPGKEAGMRLYFAKYTDKAGTSLEDRMTLIIRGTEDYKDIAHKSGEDETPALRVAWNYGDPCPPRCKPEQDITTFCLGGEYNAEGHFSSSNCPE